MSKYAKQPDYTRVKLDMPFTGITSFRKYPICTDLEELDADFAIIGVPNDMTTAWRSGARMGPRSIREQSSLYAFGSGYDHEKDIVYNNDGWKIVDCGDVSIINGDVEQSHENTEEAIRKIISKGAIPIVLGGDHSVTNPIAFALEESKEKINVVQIDAHLDWLKDASGQRFTLSNPMRRMSEMDHIDKMAQLGIRGVGSSQKEDFDDARAYGSTILSPKQIRKIGIEEALKDMPDGEKYYVTIDIDGLDASIAPGAGSPSPGGFYYDEVSEILEAVAKKGEVIGFDLVEVNPLYDPSGVTSQIAARLIIDFINFIIREKQLNLAK
ncbi:SpeB arginase/agmatinase/formimionoglutamate hydrolase SpeB [Siminovitchia terrae]|uniref:SpeB arginase/agmatinase/formimionoglutamate hydrolase SpeB n=1 Tax=Siminovitchia terrae TaxID=1914933 RepID=A0ABQ4L398_SIMTE|nr:agmatinase [Siminovitchia terrae]GIN98747.1 SpeB arginase/agmatinase/formimionoglutamate hydrolase SpeB [Siminovitchia terrae]